MPRLSADLEAEAERLRRQARFLPPGQGRDREVRLAEMLEHAARRLAAADAVAGLVDRRMPTSRARGGIAA